MSEKKQKSNFSLLDKLPFLNKLKQIKHIGLVVAIIFGLILIYILFGDFSFFGNKSGKTNTSASSEVVTYQTSAEYVEKMEAKLTSLLSKVKGAGHVEIMISVKSGSGVDLAENTETKTTNANNTQTTTVSTTPVLIENGNSQTPIVVAEILPEINGVVVVSSGASDVNVRMHLISAVQTLLDLPQSKIQILVGN